MRRLRAGSCDIAFDASLLSPIEADLRVLPSPAISACVSSARGAVVSFKRYREPIELEGRHARAVTLVAASGGRSFNDLAIALALDAAGVRPLLSDLDRCRLTIRHASGQSAALSCCESAFLTTPFTPSEKLDEVRMA